MEVKTSKDVAAEIMTTNGYDWDEEIVVLAFDYATLTAKNTELEELLEAQNRLLVCYRLGTRKGIDKILDDIHRLEAFAAIFAAIKEGG